MFKLKDVKKESNKLYGLVCTRFATSTYMTLHHVKIFFDHFGYSTNSFSMNPRVPPRVRFVARHERIQIESSQSLAQEMYDDCLEPTSPPMSPTSDFNSDDANSSAASGFEYLPRGPAQSLFLKMTNTDQLAVGSCHF